MTTIVLCWLSLLLGVIVGYGLAALSRRDTSSPLLEIHYASPQDQKLPPDKGGQPSPSWPYWEICTN